MSQINANAINTTYPVAGQDNDSQGFRDNFTAIAAGLASAKMEITELQNKSLTSTTLNITDSSTFVTAPATNNMLGATLSNGNFVQFNGLAVGSTDVTSSGATVDLNVAPFQVFNMTANGVLTLSNWPDVTTQKQYAVIRLMLTATGSTRTVTIQGLRRSNNSASTIKIPTSAGGLSQSSSTVATLSVDTTHTEIIEAWSIDGGQTIFLKNTGEY
jgi:hypothetical protein